MAAFLVFKPLRPALGALVRNTLTDNNTLAFEVADGADMVRHGLAGCYLNAFKDYRERGDNGLYSSNTVSCRMGLLHFQPRQLWTVDSSAAPGVGMGRLLLAKWSGTGDMSLAAKFGCRRWNKIPHEPYQDPQNVRAGLQTQLIHTLNRKNPTLCRRCRQYIGAGEKVVRVASIMKRRTAYHQACYVDAHGEPIFP